MKISLENQVILKRLQERQSFYRVDEWEGDFKKREKILRKMCEYPYILQQRNEMQSINDSYGEGSAAAGNVSVMSAGGAHNSSLLNPFGTIDTAQASRLPRLNKSLAD